MTGCAGGQSSFPLMFKLVCLDRRRVDAEGVVEFIEEEAESDEPEADGVTGMVTVVSVTVPVEAAGAVVSGGTFLGPTI